MDSIWSAISVSPDRSEVQMHSQWERLIKEANAPDFLKLSVLAAIGKVLADDEYLLTYDGHERSITHCLGRHLACELRATEWNVDCEYSKNGHDSRKMIALKPTDAQLKKRRMKREGSLVYLDVIVHKRGNTTE